MIRAVNQRSPIMPSLRTFRNAVRVIVIAAIGAVLIKIAPTLASHAAGHSTTYSAAPAPAARAQ
jgi:hypothetical protein